MIFFQTPESYRENLLIWSHSDNGTVLFIANASAAGSAQLISFISTAGRQIVYLYYYRILEDLKALFS
jgi:hypothetical protein